MKVCSVNNCSNPVFSGGKCKFHMARKPLKKGNKQLVFKKKEASSSISKMRGLFLSIWAKRPHRSEVSGTSLGKEPLTIFFHHILPKEHYKEAMYDEENIILLTFDDRDWETNRKE